MLEMDLVRSRHRRCSVKKGVLSNSENSQENTYARDSFFNKVAGLRPVKFLRAAFLQNTSERLLLSGHKKRNYKCQ